MRGYDPGGDLYGRMKHRISFVQVTGSKNDPNANNTSEAPIYECYAAVERINSREGTFADRVTQSNSVVFITRHESTIDDPTLKISYKGSEYDIEGIENLQLEDAFLRITATRRI